MQRLRARRFCRITELVDPARYLPLLKALFALEPKVFIIGGIAEDALLNGTMTRDHYDVDMTTYRDTVPLREGQLAELGFPRLEVKHEVLPGLAMVYETGYGDLHVEIGPYDELIPGDISFVAPGENGPMRIHSPDDIFTYPATTIDGVPIQTVSPLALFLGRAGLEATGALGPLDDRGVATQRRLREELLVGVPEGKLRPRLEPLDKVN